MSGKNDLIHFNGGKRCNRCLIPGRQFITVGETNFAICPRCDIAGDHLPDKLQAIKDGDVK